MTARHIEGEIKCPVYIVVMMVAVPCAIGKPFYSMMVVVHRGGGRMKLTAPIVVVAGGNGGHRRLW
jgi:hypothetical protein